VQLSLVISLILNVTRWYRVSYP